MVPPAASPGIFFARSAQYTASAAVASVPKRISNGVSPLRPSGPAMPSAVRNRAACSAARSRRPTRSSARRMDRRAIGIEA